MVNTFYSLSWDEHTRYTNVRNSAEEYAESFVKMERQWECHAFWYLHHHGMINLRKKLISGYAANSSGVSHNNIIYLEPDTIAESVWMLLRARKKTVAIPSNVKEMLMRP